jgi:hypothetical protein
MTAAAEWARCRLWIAAALKTSPTHDLKDVELGVATGALQFWPGERCAVITEIADYPKGRMLNFWLLGGDLKELMRMRPSIEAWGRSQGCRWASGTGRSAWRRVLGKHGYRELAVDFIKEI